MLHALLLVTLLASPLSAQICGMCSTSDCPSSVETQDSVRVTAEPDTGSHCSAKSETTRTPAPEPDSCCELASFSEADGCSPERPGAVIAQTTDDLPDPAAGDTIATRDLQVIVAGLGAITSQRDAQSQSPASLFTLHSVYLI